MKGIYLHIPFCRSRCAYCDFYSTTDLDRRERYVEALLSEWQQRRNEIKGPIATVYFGGGTPSLLSAQTVERILTSLLQDEAPREREITLEANPDSISPEYLKSLKAAGVNRLSIGIQSLQDDLLRTIGRRHNAEQALQAIEAAREAGFTNLSVDLMYGLPGQTSAQWKADIETVLRFKPEHISTYCLSYEEGTRLTALRDKGEVQEQEDETLNSLYDYLCQRLQQAGYEHYEVSNFALPGYKSQHNSHYWDRTPYIGLGAGAHSFDGERRSWNPNDIAAYIEGILAQSLTRESEQLTQEQQHIEAVMLGLRTKEGIDAALVEDKKETIEDYLRRGLLVESRKTAALNDKRYCATQEGIHILNDIIATLI